MSIENNSVFAIQLGISYLKDRITDPEEYILIEIKNDISVSSTHGLSIWTLIFKKKGLIPLVPNEEKGLGGEILLKIDIKKKEVLKMQYLE